MTKLEQLKSILESQDSDPEDWPRHQLQEVNRLDHMTLLVLEADIGFAFSNDGEAYLGMFNWKE